MSSTPLVIENSSLYQRRTAKAAAAASAARIEAERVALIANQEKEFKEFNDAVLKTRRLLSNMTIKTPEAGKKEQQILNFRRSRRMALVRWKTLRSNLRKYLKNILVVSYV